MKKLLVVSMVVVLGLNSVTFADKHHHVNQTLCASQIIPVTARASDAGWFIGLQGGLGLVNAKNLENTFRYINGNIIYFNQVHGDTGFVGRIFVGYDLNKYFALEGGYSYFFTESYFAGMASRARTTAFDMYGKGKMPLIHNVDLYAKLGMNYLMANIDTAGANRQNVGVAFGAGVDYHCTSNVIANLEWSRMNGNERICSDKYQSDTDTFMVGIRYKFDA